MAQILITLLAVALVAAVVAFLVERSRRRVHAVTPGLHEEITLPHQAEFELWHNAFSLCSKKLRVCLAELGIDYVGHHVDLVETGRYGNLDPDFLKVNPAATVPVLVHRGHPVYESHEQIRHAADFAGEGRSLVPDDPALRALMEEWIEFGSLVGDDPMTDLERTAGNCIPGLTLPLFAAMNQSIGYREFLVGVLFHRLRMRPIGMMLMKWRGPGGLLRTPPLAVAMRRSHAAMSRHLDALESALVAGAGPWIVGDQFTLADVGMMVILDRLEEGAWLEGLLQDRPRTSDYWIALQGRDSYASAIVDQAHATVAAGSRRIDELRMRDPAFAAALAGRFAD